MAELGAGKGRYPEAMILAAANQVCRCGERWDRMSPRQVAVEILDAAYVDRIMAGERPWQEDPNVKG